MAGSWRHMTTNSGRLRNPETFAQQIENLGDAYEAAEQCYGMIWWLADQFGMLHGTRTRDVIREAETHWRDGLNVGGVQQ